MRKTMKKLTQGATRLLVLALGLGLASTGWAAASLEETGATVPTTATLAFKGATLSQVTADTLSGVMGGDWAGAVAGNAMTFNNFDRTSEASGTITCQAQVQHDTNVKGVLLTFTQDGANVKVTKTGAKYISGTVGQSIAGGTDGYYDVSKLKLTLTRVVPNVCWVENFPSSSTTVNGVSLNPVNGSSTVTDGVITYGNPGNANGPAFSFDAAGYVAIVFTVDFTGVTLAENQILFTLGNGTYNGLVGAALKSNGSGGFYATGIWANGTWTNADDSSNTVTLSGEQTFLAIYNKGEDASTKGTHLYVLDNGVAKVIYGGTSGIGLKGGDVTKLGIGGAFGSFSSFTNMAGLKLKKVAVYLSSSSLPMTASDLPGHSYMAKFAVANGETINASTINAGATTFGSAYVSTEAGATINLDAELNGHAITFAGSISGVPGSADGLTLGSANDSVTTTVAANVPNIKGSGTVVYNGVAPDSSYSWMTASAWSGVLWLKNLAIAGLVPANLASANSTLRLTGCTGYFNNGGNTSTCPGTIDLQDDGSTKAFTVDNGWSDSGISIFEKLTGTGTLTVSTRNIGQRYVFKDPSEFRGTIDTVNGSFVDLRVILGDSTTAPTRGTITVVSGANATVAAGKTWTANNGIIVNGTLTKEDSTATLPGTITGSGKIVYNDELPNSADFTANTWTGTVEVNGGSTTSAGIEAANATQFMNAGSTFSVASGTVTLGTAAGLTGAVNVNSGATLQIVDSTATDISLAGTNNGTVNLQMASALTTLTLSDGIARGTVVYPNTLTTLNVALTETIADDGRASFTCGSASPTSGTLTLTRPDGTTENIAGTVEGATISFAWVPAVSGPAAWCAYEFASNLNNSGDDTTALSADGTFSATTSVDGDGKLYTYSHPYRNIAYPADGNWSAMVRCTVPKLAEAIVVTFGTRAGGLIGLAAGATPDSEMYLVQTTNGGGSYDSHYVTNAVMPVLNGTTAQHVYVFTVASNQTVKIYCDNSLIETKVFDSPFTIGGGIQIGAIHGGMGNVGLHGCRSDGTAADPAYSALSEADQKAARVDSMRLYKGVLGPNAIAQLSEEFPAVKLFEATISGGDANAWGSLAWTGGDISTINAYSKAIVTVEDDATLTLPASITADELVFDIASGKTLTLVEAGDGTTFAIGHPIEVNTGAVAFDASSKTLDFAIGGTGYVFVDTGKTISVASGGSLSRISGLGTVTYASYGSLPSALAFGEWTGTVVLPSFVAEGVNFNNYGQTGSTIALTGITSGWIDPDHSSASAKLRLDGAVNITAMSARTYTFAEIDGTGNLSFATTTQPTAITIAKVAEGYSGIISNTTERDVTITTLDRQAGTTVTPGSKLLTTSGRVAASALAVGGVAQSVTLFTESDGIYVAAASVQKGENTPTYHTTVAAAMTEAGSDAATITLLADTNSDIALAVGQSLATGGFNVGTVSTGATYYHVVNNAGVYTVVLDTYTITIPSVANTTVSVIYTSGSAAQEATAEGDITVDAGTSLTATWTAASGYKITAGASQTINPVVSAQTLDSPTVEVKGVTVSGVTFDYGDDFATATVTATVSGDATAYTLTVGGTDYAGTVDGTTVTFSNVVTGHSSAYDSVSYEITATDGTSSVVVSGGSGAAPVADVTADWINERAASATGTSASASDAGGSWTNAVSYTNGKAEISDNRFEAATASTASQVVLEFNVCFSSVSDADVNDTAQAAIKLGEDDNVTTFKVLTTGNAWMSVSNAELPIDPSETYKVVLTIDYGSNAYGVTVGNYVMTNSTGDTTFPLAKSGATSVQNIDFAGSGTLTSMKGDQLEGYMVKDNVGNRYATIQEATQAYNSANGPYTVLHDGTAPSGWKIDETTKALIKLAKGFFFMAY